LSPYPLLVTVTTSPAGCSVECARTESASSGPCRIGKLLPSKQPYWSRAQGGSPWSVPPAWREAACFRIMDHACAGVYLYPRPSARCLPRRSVVARGARRHPRVHAARDLARSRSRLYAVRLRQPDGCRLTATRAIKVTSRPASPAGPHIHSYEPQAPGSDAKLGGQSEAMV
jgi:hypothetical protein